MEKLFNNGTPKCPYCGYEERKWHELGFISDGDDEEVTCPSCEKEYTAIITIDFAFDTFKKEPK